MDDARHHLRSLLMRESLVDKDVIRSTEGPVVRMLPDVHVVKIGGLSVMDRGRELLPPLVEALGRQLERRRLILATGGGARSRHVFSIGLDLGMPTGVLAELSAADALGNAHILGTLLAPYGVVAIPPEMFGHLLPLFITAAPGVIFNGVPPYKLWEHPPKVGRIPTHRSDTGCFLVAEAFGCRSLTLVKDVDGLYEEDPKLGRNPPFIPSITTSELRARNLPTLPFDPVLLDLLESARLVKEFRLVNAAHPRRLERLLEGGERQREGEGEGEEADWDEADGDEAEAEQAGGEEAI
jgi:molybdenum storage protein